MDRRKFINFGIGALISPFSNNLFAQTLSKNQPNLLFVLLKGGADGLSMLVPYNDSNYYEARPTISIQKNKCLSLGSTFGLNPALNNYANWYKGNQAIFIPAAGQLNNSRSHFQAQDVLQFGVNNVTAYHSGFLARLQEVLGTIKAISFTENLTPIMTSEKLTIPTVATPHLQGVFNFKNQNIQYSGKLNDIYSSVQKNMTLIKQIEESTKNFPYRLSSVAAFMKTSQCNIGFVEFTDWDTHGDQGSLDGALFKLLKNFNEELGSFRKSFGEDYWKNTLVVVMSEFGRTLKQNGNGSDHGHGNLMSLFGGLITQSKIAGDWLSLKEANLHEKRDLKVIYQYRDILSEIFVKMYGLNKNQIEYIFPESNPTKFNLI